MKILFDHCVARPLRKELPHHEIKTTHEMGWAGLNVKNNLTWEIVELELGTALPEQKGEIMKSLAEKWIEEGEQIGAQQEAAKLTLRQLHQRFGILGVELDERIRSLSTEQLENLSGALLFFTSKDDLLAWLDKR